MMKSIIKESEDDNMYANDAPFKNSIILGDVIQQSQAVLEENGLTLNIVEDDIEINLSWEIL